MRKQIELCEVLAKELKSDTFRLAFDEHLFYLQMARLISDRRQRAGISQTELAKRSGVSQPMIARLEKGDHRRTPTFDTLFRLLQALGYDMFVNVQRKKRAGKAA